MIRWLVGFFSHSNSFRLLGCCDKWQVQSDSKSITELHKLAVSHVSEFKLSAQFCVQLYAHKQRWQPNLIQCIAFCICVQNFVIYERWPNLHAEIKSNQLILTWNWINIWRMKENCGYQFVKIVFVGGVRLGFGGGVCCIACAQTSIHALNRNNHLNWAPAHGLPNRKCKVFHFAT